MLSGAHEDIQNNLAKMQLEDEERFDCSISDSEEISVFAGNRRQALLVLNNMRKILKRDEPLVAELKRKALSFPFPENSKARSTFIAADYQHGAIFEGTSKLFRLLKELKGELSAAALEGYQPLEFVHK